MLVTERASALANCRFIDAKGAGHDVHASHDEWLAETVVEWRANVSARTATSRT